MARPFATTSKFIGVAGLGLLSSSALTLSFFTPALLDLPSPSDAFPVFRKLRQHAAAAHGLISVASATALSAAFLISPRFARHPYLLWMTLAVGVGSQAVPRLLNVRGIEAMNETALAEEGRGRSGQELRINGEVVRELLEGWSKVLKWQSLTWSIGWVMGMVGLWGDGY